MVFKIACMALVLYMVPFVADVYSQTPTVQLVDVRQTYNDQVVLFTLDYQSETYEWGADIPLGVDPPTYISAHTDRYMSDIYRKMYLQAPNNLHSLIQWEAWITAGAKVNGKTILKKPFKGKHPRSIQLKKDLTVATSIPALKIIIKQMLGE